MVTKFSMYNQMNRDIGYCNFILEFNQVNRDIATVFPPMDRNHNAILM